MAKLQRARMEIEGIVQGVGFRPFVYGLAGRFGLSGWVRNTGRGVEIEVEGEKGSIASFCHAITNEPPPLASISALRIEQLHPAGREGFAILDSCNSAGGIEVSPDCDVCDDCLRELFDPHDRRYLYPFINCTNCGPRYSIITGAPYDRPATTMAPFGMCESCLAEYLDPLSRRFHAQPNACPVCGPTVSLLDSSGVALPGDPLVEALRALSAGRIVAIKGVGGFHLAADACNDEAVARLRLRKNRDEKPFALLAADLAAVREFANCSEREARLLSAVERPIVMLRKLPGNCVSDTVAPRNGWIGVMLPGNPLQHLLLRGRVHPLVMTSGSLSDEPIAYRDGEALERLSAIADLFLTHDREIRTPADDSVLRLYRGEPLFLRRSRGYAPRGVNLPCSQPSVLAVGAELKGTICLTRGGKGFLSQHIGDMKDAATLESMEETVGHLGRLLHIAPDAVAHDLHPDYLSTHYASRLPLPAVAVQHHHAHLASCMAENRLDGEVIGVILDAAGYGTDGAIWGGEFLVGGYRTFERCGHFGYLKMPGGDAAVKEPYRMAISVLYALYGDKLFERPLPFFSRISEQEKGLFIKMLERGINAPLTSSCGRLFDAVAALLGIREVASYEGQAAMELEALAERGSNPSSYPYLISGGECHTVDFAPMFAAICDDVAAGRDSAGIARSFHHSLARVVCEVCELIREERGEKRVVLSGGLFQNRLLTEEVSVLLNHAGLDVYCHRLVPPNDGGIALGQAVIAGAELLRRERRSRLNP
jgi:hydrogenase maturation protein HypF